MNDTVSPQPPPSRGVESGVVGRTEPCAMGSSGGQVIPAGGHKSSSEYPKQQY